MPENPESPLDPKPYEVEYEDPHYHDEDDVVASTEEDPTRKVVGPRPGKKPARKLPPPRRRFTED